MENTQKEKFGFIFTFYRWVVGTLVFLALIYLLAGLLAQALGLESVYSSPVALGMISLGVFWLLTVLQYRGLLKPVTQWGIGQSAKMYHCAQMGLLPPMLRKVNQHEVPLVLTGVQRSMISMWFFVQTFFLAAALSGGRFDFYVLFMTVSLYILVALPFALYSRHNKDKHKTIVLPPDIKASDVGKHRFSLSYLRVKYEIRPAAEDYLPFSRQRKLVREHMQAQADAEQEFQEQERRQAEQIEQTEQVVEADEIEYAD